MSPSQVRKLRQGLSCEGIGQSLSPEAGPLKTYFSTQDSHGVGDWFFSVEGLF